MEKSENKNKIARVAKGAMFPRVAIIGFIIALVVQQFATQEVTIGIIAISLILGYFIQNNYDAETEAGLEDGRFFIKKGKATSWFGGK